MKRSVLNIIFILISLFVKAQQVGEISHAFYKPMVYNPAYAGYEENINAMLLSHSQWTGFKGSPQLNLFTIDGSLMNEKAGLGLSLVSDKRGLNKRSGGYINYAYRILINEKSSLRFGIAAGVVDHTINFSGALVENSSDPYLFGGEEHKTVFDVNAGLALILNKFELGISVPQLLNNKINYVDDTAFRSSYIQSRHYLASLKYSFGLSKEKKIFVVPAAMVRIVPNAPLQYNATLNFEWQDKFWIGATYKSAYALTAHAGICIHKQLSIGYAYDIILGNLSNDAGISHEIMVNFKFGRKDKEEHAPEPAAEKAPDRTAEFEKRLDSLQQVVTADQNKIEEDRRKINELNTKLDQQAKIIASAPVQQSPVQQSQQTSPVAQPTVTETQPGQQSNSTTNNTNNEKPVPSGSQNTGNQNAAAVESNANKVMNNGVWFVTNSNKDYKDANNNVPRKGFYVIAGTFTYRDFAEAEVKRLANSGFSKTGWMFNSPKQFNYVYIANPSTKSEAIKKAEADKSKGIKDAWVLELTE
jgi:type IX secretion system PorP/SprF family membrane protein